MFIYKKSINKAIRQLRFHLFRLSAGSPLRVKLQRLMRSTTAFSVHVMFSYSIYVRLFYTLAVKSYDLNGRCAFCVGFIAQIYRTPMESVYRLQISLYVHLKGSRQIDESGPLLILAHALFPQHPTLASMRLSVNKVLVVLQYVIKSSILLCFGMWLLILGDECNIGIHLTGPLV